MRLASVSLPGALAGIITQECRGQDRSRGPDSCWEISVTGSEPAGHNYTQSASEQNKPGDVSAHLRNLSGDIFSPKRVHW